MSILLVIIFVLFALIFEGFFSGSEMALVRADRYRLKVMAHAGFKGAKIALFLMSTPSRFFSIVIFGTNICVVSASVVITMFVITRLGFEYSPLAMLYGPIALVLGEIVPKTIYQRHADELIPYVSPVLLIFYYLFYPFVWLLSAFANHFLKRVKKSIPESALSQVTREDLESMVNFETENTDMKFSERKMVSKILNFSEKVVENIMTPLVDVVAISINASREEAKKIFIDTGYSRLPIFQGRVYNLVGFIKNSDLIFNREEKLLQNMVRPVFYVPEDMPLGELYHEMHKSDSKIAVAVDEYGAATGIVTDEDLWEEVVGEIRDEYDEDGMMIRKLGKNHFIVSGRLEIEHANSRLKLNIHLGDYETVAGYLLFHLEHIPKDGEQIEIDGVKYIVKKASKKAIQEIEVIKS